jgi:hypothetical protein
MVLYFDHDSAAVAIDSQYQSLFNFRGGMEVCGLTVTTGGSKSQQSVLLLTGIIVQFEVINANSVQEM